MLLVILSGFLKELKMILGTEDTRASIPLVLHIYDPGFESQHHQIKANRISEQKMNSGKTYRLY